MDELSSCATKQTIAELWKRNIPLVLERLAVLDTAAASNPMATELRLKALDLAHKLAGSLGMFGFLAASEAARELEDSLQAESPDPLRIRTIVAELRSSIFPPGSVRE